MTLNKMRTIFLLCNIAFSMPAASSGLSPSCWILTDMAGASNTKDESYVSGKDKFSQPITLLLNGDRSSATGDSIQLHQVDDYMAIGFNKTNTFTTNESYLVDPDLGVAIYTKAVSVKGALSGLTGARMFTGKARECK